MTDFHNPNRQRQGRGAPNLRAHDPRPLAVPFPLPPSPEATMARNAMTSRGTEALARDWIYENHEHAPIEHIREALALIRAAYVAELVPPVLQHYQPLPDTPVVCGANRDGLTNVNRTSHPGRVTCPVCRSKGRTNFNPL